MNSNMLRGFTKGATVLAVASMVFVAGCSDDDDEFTLERPGTLSFRNDVEEVQLSWGSSAADGDSEFGGYHVYRDTESMSGLEPSEFAALRITTTAEPPGDTVFTDGTVVEGVRYYYMVRSVDINDNVSAPSNEVVTASVQSGAVIEFGEFASPDPSGIDLSAGMALSMVDANAGLIDFYLGTADDSATGPLVLKSPHLVNDDAKWQTVRTDFLMLDSDDISSADAASFSSSTLELGTGEEVDGKVIAVRITEADNEIHYGKLEVLSFDEDGEGRSLSIDWTYQPIPGFARF